MTKFNYRKLANLLEKWTVNEYRKGRDLSEYIRKEISKTSSQHNSVNSPTLSFFDKDGGYESFERLADNVHYKMYPRSYDTTSTGLSGSEITKFLLKNLEEDTEIEETKKLK